MAGRLGAAGPGARVLVWVPLADGQAEAPPGGAAARQAEQRSVLTAPPGSRPRVGRFLSALSSRLRARGALRETAPRASVLWAGASLHPVPRGRAASRSSGPPSRPPAPAFGLPVPKPVLAKAREWQNMCPGPGSLAGGSRAAVWPVDRRQVDTGQAVGFAPQVAHFLAMHLDSLSMKGAGTRGSPHKHRL